MAFWDWLFDPTGETRNQPNRNAIPGTPTSIFGKAGRGSNKPDFGKALLDTSRRIKERYENRGQNQIQGGGSVGRHGGSGFQDWNDVFGGAEDSGPTTEDILAELERMQDPSRYLQDSGSLAQQAMAQASAQYDPIISALRQQMGSAESRANRNKLELGNMFSSLSTDLQGDVPEIQQMYAGDKAESKASFDSLQQQLKNNYAQSAAEQEEMMKRLNIQAAAPDILPEQQRDRDFFTNLASRDAAVEQTALGQEERGAVNFTQQGSQIARSEGTSRQADLMNDLAELLGEYEGQIGSQQAAKQQSYLSTLMGLQNDQVTGAQAAAQRDFENYIKVLQLGRELKKDEIGSGVIKSVKSPSDVAGRAMGMGVDERGSQRIQDVFMQAIGQDPQILSGTNPLFGNSLSKEALAQRVVDYGKKAGMNRAEINALQTIALEYFGRS